MFEVKEKPRLVEKASLGCYFKRRGRANAESLLDELDELVSIWELKFFIKSSPGSKDLSRISYRKGKFNEIIEEVSELGCDVIIFSNGCLQANKQLGGRIQSFGR